MIDKYCAIMGVCLESDIAGMDRYNAKNTTRREAGRKEAEVG